MPGRPDRDRGLAMTNTTIRPLYGHTSEATAYVVADYPYGRRLRTTKTI